MFKTFTFMSRQLSFSVILGTAFGFLFAGYMVLAQFSEPPVGPSGGNTKPPLNEGVSLQTKDGALEVNALSTADVGLWVYKGYTQVDLITTISAGSVCPLSASGWIILRPDLDTLLICRVNNAFNGDWRGF